jgi:uncharacterized protein YdcH (DUF465 family)
MSNAATINLMGRRIIALRVKDAYFDALCETYSDLDRQIGKLKVDRSFTNIHGERLKRQRASILDTILFVLEDQPTHQQAA